jgi:hypothetical protein
MKVLGSSVLATEAIIVFLAMLVAAGNGSIASQWTAVIIGIVLAAVLVAAIGTLRRPWGPWFGSILQVVVVGIGFLAPLMFVVGGIFAVLWFFAVRLGTRVDRMRAAAAGSGEGSAAPEAS